MHFPPSPQEDGRLSENRSNEGEEGNGERADDDTERPGEVEWFAETRSEYPVGEEDWPSDTEVAGGTTTRSAPASPDLDDGIL